MRNDWPLFLAEQLIFIRILIKLILRLIFLSVMRNLYGIIL